jgi:hypothetical protein
MRSPALAKFGYVDLDLEVDHEAKTLVPPSMPGEEPRESDRPTTLPPSGVMKGGDRVSAMRELYEAGDVEAALALGASLASLFDNGESIPERIGVEDDEEEFSPFDGLRELQAPLSAAIAELDEDEDEDENDRRSAE